VALPLLVVRTPAYYVLQAAASGIAANDFVNHMVVRRLAQFNPDSYLGVAARPSAPFLYANNWGNVYSLLLPVVIAYLVSLRRSRRPRDRMVRRSLVAAIALSVPPAAYTLNRGMLIGLGVAAVYLAVRLAARGRVSAMLVIALLAVAGAVAFERLAGSRLETRLQGSGTSTRASLYVQSIELARKSPIFGYGVPPTSLDPSAPPVGTQGQFWMVLVSNGPVAVAAFLSFFAGAWLRSWRRWDTIGLTASALCLVAVVELGFYGAVPYGLPIMMVLAAVALRPVSWATPVDGAPR
jgi:O-antigen ligase